MTSRVGGRVVGGLTPGTGRVGPAPDAQPGCEDERMPVSILLVDDDDAFRAALADTLRAAGHDRIYEAGTVAAALTAAAELRPDVALVDIGLPDGDGFQLACELAQLTEVPRVVLISTDADAADNAAAQRVGAERFLAKEELEDAQLRRLLSGP
jgi:DNA-binding NarL/FixJ family response regulator